MAVRKSTKRAAAEARWRHVVAEQEASGLTARAFARRRGIAEGTLAWWKSELKRRGAPRRRCSRKPGAALAQVHLVGEPAALATPAEGFAVDLAGGRRLFVPAGFDAGALRRLLEVLEGRPC